MRTSSFKRNLAEVYRMKISGSRRGHAVPGKATSESRVSAGGLMQSYLVFTLHERLVDKEASATGMGSPGGGQSQVLKEKDHAS
jgi:hypothetical protein